MPRIIARPGNEYAYEYAYCHLHVTLLDLKAFHPVVQFSTAKTLSRANDLLRKPTLW